MAIFSPLSSLASTAKDTTKKTIGISKILTKSTQTKKNLYASKNIFRRRRIENVKRGELKDRFLAPILVTRPGGPRALALGDSGTSINDRLLGFVGYLSAGWILSNMPTWIAIGNQFSGRLITASKILSNYGDESVRAMEGITDVFGAALENISKFDFTDNSNLLKSSLDDLKTELDTLGGGLAESFGVLLKPFKDIPELGTYQPDEPAQNPTPNSKTTPSSPGGDPTFWTLVAVASREDADPQGQADVAQSIYNRAASGAYGSKNIRELILRKSQYAPTWKFPRSKSEQTPNKEWYQITDAQSAAKATGFSVGTIQNVAKNITNPSLQKESAKFVSGRTDFRGYSVAGGIQRKSGDNYFGWYESYRGNQTAAVPNLVDTPPVAKQTPTPKQTPKQPPITGQGRLQRGGTLTKTIGKDVGPITISSIVGDARKHGPHGGIDITAPSGTYISLRVDAEWVGYAYQPRGYGHVLDLWIPSYGIQLRFAHLLQQPAKLSKIPAGTSFARVGSSGDSTGSHIHLEYDTKKDTRGGGALRDDPDNYAAKLDQYVKLLLLTKNPNKGKFSPAATSSISLVPGSPSITMDAEDQVEMKNNSYLEGLLSGITQERKGQKIIIVDDRGSVIQQIVSSGSRGNSQVQIPDSVLLNKFIKHNLLLDLNYT